MNCPQCGMLILQECPTGCENCRERIEVPCLPDPQEIEQAKMTILAGRPSLDMKYGGCKNPRVSGIREIKVDQQIRRTFLSPNYDVDLL